MNQTKILNALYELGFKAEETDGYGYVFDYEGLRLLYKPDEDDDVFFRLSAPLIYEVEDEENRVVTLDIINEVNSRIKYSKTMLQGDNVWVSYESRLFDGMDTEEFLRFAILVVQATVDLFFRMINGKEDPFGEEDDQNDNSNEE